MSLNPRLVLLCLFTGAVLFSPVIAGAFPVFTAAPVAGALSAFAVYAFCFARSQRPKKVALALLSTCFAVTCFDLAARPALYYLLDARPKELSARRWPPLPEVYRFEPNLRFRGETFGDLAAAAMRKDWREYRTITFSTDARGFRNDSQAQAGARPFDLLVVGDSFCVGDGTSQEDVWANVLARGRGLSAYNLCMDGAGPWQEYVNLLVEGESLKAREGAVVLWVLFEGNDLEDPYFPQLRRSQLPWQGALGHLLHSFKEFRYRSPLRRLLFVGTDEGFQERAVERKFPDGRRVLFSELYARRRGRTLDDVRRHPNFQNLAETFAAMKRLADERRLRVAVVFAPSKEEIYSWALEGAPPWSSSAEPSGLAAAVGELCARQGFPFLDLKPAMLEASKRAFDESGELLWWRDDTHWNPAGHRVVASVVSDRLLRGLLLEPANPRLYTDRR